MTDDIKTPLCSRIALDNLLVARRRLLEEFANNGLIPVLTKNRDSAPLPFDSLTVRGSDFLDCEADRLEWLEGAIWPEAMIHEYPGLLDESRHVRELAYIQVVATRETHMAIFEVPVNTVSTRHRSDETAYGIAKGLLSLLRYAERIRAQVQPEVSRSMQAAVHESIDEVLRRAYEELKQVLHRDRVLRRKVFDQLTTALDSSLIDWTNLRSEPTGLAILYNFAPFADTGSTVASKRIRAFGHTLDVIANSSLNRKELDPTIETISTPYVNQRMFLDHPPSWASWEPFKRFCKQGLKQIEELGQKGRRYSFLYSRAMWAPSHYLAAAYKRHQPDVEWIAEFSDPLSLDVEGNPRGEQLYREPFLDELLFGVEDEYGTIPDEYFTNFGLAEIIPFAFADTLLFTNEHQLQTMLEHVYSDQLQERVRQHAEVANHPTLPSEYYRASDIKYEVDPHQLNLGYFGEFYATRGLTDLTTALRMLPSFIRDEITLHVFTNFVPGGLGSKPPGMAPYAFQQLVQRADEGVDGASLENQVIFNRALPYLDFLSATSKFDYLIVNDAHSGENHPVNPYLPSKWSDYAGSCASVWAFVEEGSVLSTKPAEIKTLIGDQNAAREKLWQLVEQKNSRREG